MKRAWLIAGGTLGGLGAVLAITPPDLSSDSSLGAGLALTPATSTTTDPTPAATTAAPATTQSAKPAKSGTATQTTKPAATQSAAPVETKAPATQAPATTSGKAQSGTFTGDPYTMRYGTVQVKITINNGKITDAIAVQAPSGRDQRYTDMAIPVMRQKTLSAQSSNITSVSGASYTAYAWYISLQSALSKAGWM